MDSLRNPDLKAIMERVFALLPKLIPLMLLVYIPILLDYVRISIQTVSPRIKT